MLQTNNGLQLDDRETINSGQASLGELIGNVLGLLRRNLLIIFCTTLIGIATGAVYVAYAPRIYAANAEIMIDARKLQIFQQQPVFGDHPLDSAAVESQIQILQSKAIALSVVSSLNLANDPSFIEQSKGVMSWLFGLLPNRSSSTAPSSDFDRSEEAAAAIEQNLKVTRVGPSYVIKINFLSRSPERAAQIANAIAGAYFADQIEARHQSMQRTAAWLQDRLGELRNQQRSADRLVADFKTKNSIVTAKGQPIKEDELSLLNNQLIAARAHTSEMQARLDRIEAIMRSGSSATTLGGADPTVSDTLTNPIINKLREKYLDYVGREADLSSKYGNNHFAVVNLRRQIRELRASILDELKRIGETYKSEYEIAKQRQDALETAFTEAVTNAGLDTKTLGPLRELQGSADSYRALYDGLLQRYVQSVQEQSSPTTEARLLTPASPSKSASGPKAILIAALTSMGGLMFGVGIGVVRQLTDRVFRTADQVEAALHTECISIVPIQRGTKGRTSKPPLAVVSGRASILSRRGVMWDVIGDPFSQYAEAIRLIKFAVDSNNDAMVGKVIGVTSSLPNEGKSTIAGSLALLAADAGAKTILVDCDLRNPQLSRRLAPNAKLGVLNVIGGELPIEQVVLIDASTRLAFLPTSFSKHRAHSNELLISDAVRKLFEQLRTKYDYIVVDLPPIAPIVDVRSTTRFIDSYILAVEWGCTKVNLVQHALKQASGIDAKLIGAVLNKTPIASLGKYQGHLNDYYDGTRFERYGREASSR